MQLFFDDDFPFCSILLRFLIRDNVGPFGLLNTAPMMALLCSIMANPQFQSHELIGRFNVFLRNEILIIVNSSETVSRIPVFYLNVALRTKKDSKHRQNLVRLLQLYWPRCIQEVRRRKLDAEARRNWEDIGKHLKLKDSVDSLQVRRPWRRTKPCHLSTCLCNHINCEHPMFVCKGCWHVYYCSTKCQTMQVALLSTDYDPRVLTILLQRLERRRTQGCL